MNGSDSNPERNRAIADEAAAWVIRQERGLTASEQDALSQWLGMDARHRAALAAQRWSWEELDRLAGLQTSVGAIPDRHLLAPRRRAVRSWLRMAGLPLAIAAVVAVVVQSQRPAVRENGPTGAASRLALCEQKQLEDGSLVELNRGTAISVAFSASERRVRLERGEAHFSIAKDPARPFLVEAAGVVIQAVGTEFSVTLESHAVAVLVTEGKVRVGSGENPLAGHTKESPIVEAGHRALVSLASRETAPQISPVSAAAINQHLAWKPRLLEFDESTLEEIAAEFNRHNPVKLILGEASVAGRRLSGTFRSDNVEAFVHLMESDFGVSVTRPSNGEIVFRKTK